MLDILRGEVLSCMIAYPALRLRMLLPLAKLTRAASQTYKGLFLRTVPRAPSKKVTLNFFLSHLLSSQYNKKRTDLCCSFFIIIGCIISYTGILHDSVGTYKIQRGFLGRVRGGILWPAKNPSPQIFPFPASSLFHVKHQRLKPRTGSTRKINSLPSTGLIMQGDTLLLKHMQRRSPSTL